MTELLGSSFEAWGLVAPSLLSYMAVVLVASCVVVNLLMYLWLLKGLSQLNGQLELLQRKADVVRMQLGILIDNAR